MYQEHDFVIVESLSGQQARIRFGDLTLDDFRQEVKKQLYPHLLKKTSANATPQVLRLIWCGKEVVPGCSWHCVVTDDTKMKALNPNCKNGLPMVLAHATGGTDDFSLEDNDEEDHDHSQPSTMHDIKFSHSAF